ncbi:uncharacterized protein [Macaca fascicularis]|uniref:uncharacterized protein n=1 Tax=Macaca fascicularis TaxID=9541 RepID=UPI003D153A1B
MCALSLLSGDLFMQHTDSSPCQECLTLGSQDLRQRLSNPEALSVSQNRRASGTPALPAPSPSAKGGPPPSAAAPPRALAPAPPSRAPAPPAAGGRQRAAARGAGVSTCHRAAAAPSFRGTCPARRLPPALPHGRRRLFPAAPRGPRAPRPAPRPPGPVSASSWGHPDGGSPARSRLHPSAPASEQPPLPPPPPPSSHPGSVCPGHGALRMPRGAGAGLRARSGVVSAAPRAPARPPPSRAPRWGHAVSHLAGDQGDPGGPLHLRHPPHPLCDPMVHLPRCGLRPWHLSAADPRGRHAGGAPSAGAMGTEPSRSAPQLSARAPYSGPRRPPCTSTASWP